MSVSVRISDSVAVVEVEDFAPLGAHDATFADALTTAIVDVNDDDDVKAVVLRTSGPDFCSPASAPAVPVSEVPTTWHRSFAASGALYQALCFSKKVVVTRVTGQCAGAGSNLVLCSDLTVASDDARLGSPFLDLPESNFVIAALTIRLNRAKAWAVRGTTYDARAAYDVGLVNRVASSTSIDDEVSAFTDAIVGMPLDGVTMSKMLQQAVYDAHGVGREFDLADHYAVHRWSL